MFSRTLLVMAIIICAAFTGAGAFYLISHPAEIPEFIGQQAAAQEMKQIKCLADNIYFEAGNQTITGMVGVAYVTINRTKTNKWPSNVCETVYQKEKSTCQFSWVCERTKPIDPPIWEKSFAVAKHVWHRYNAEKDPTNGAHYYHATYVNPGWKLQKTVQIGDHIFYK